MTPCQATPPPTGTCDKPATMVVIFQDGERALTCRDCALRLQETGRDLGASVHIETRKAAK